MGSQYSYKNQDIVNRDSEKEIVISSMIYFLGFAALLAAISFVLITLNIFTNNPRIRGILIFYDKIKLVVSIIFIFAASSAILLTDKVYFQPYYEYFVLVIIFMTVSNLVTDISIAVMHSKRQENSKIKQLKDSLIKT